MLTEIFDPELIVDTIYSKIDESDCATLSKYICKKEGIGPEQVTFMYENGIVISNETIIKGAIEFFGPDFMKGVVYDLVRMN